MRWWISLTMISSRRRRMSSNKYPENLALCELFGVKGIRISLSWTRILPEGEGRVNQKGIDYYNKLIDACIAHDVEPFVTLHHFDTPLAYKR
ncbi:family 1 glycosylhydrolase [Selenomonas bovis]|uniref:Family 1 glycosylhydrolase n=2 Tax=Selenomonas bovis TaxID=416586 RepID=A0A848B3H2_9FIRM|nr:family 1 glycosylhydrolase [Selenomonas bovis]